MKVIAAGCALKGTLGPVSASQAIVRGAGRALPGATILLHPVSDGGMGLLTAALYFLDGRRHLINTTDPWGRPGFAAWLECDDGSALIESSHACGAATDRPQVRMPWPGLPWAGPEPRGDPMRATSRGLARVIASAVESVEGPVRIGLGGSATTEGGAGLLASLGADLLDSRGVSLPDGGGPLSAIAEIRLDDILETVAAAGSSGRLQALADVRSPLLGPFGAARTFAPQKGASPQQALLLDRALERFADCLEAASGRTARALPGAGAAGGLGFGLASGLGASLTGGSDWFLQATGFDDRIAGADALLTCEGRWDGAAHPGKATAELIERAWDHDVPAALICAVASAPAPRGARLFESGGLLDEAGLERLAERAARVLTGGRDG